MTTTPAPARRRAVVPLAATLALGACAGPAPTAADGDTHVAVAVAPLSLTGVTDACYRLTVENGQGEVVWQRGGICADSYGDGASSVSYVGPCDADEPDNTVILELEDLWDAAGVVDRDGYMNPCGHADNGNTDGFAACERPFTCVEGQDVAAGFDLTVVRRAQQGFFDIAVELNDLFCSAKLDCEQDGSPLKLLHNASGARDQTAVLAFACTAGTAADDETALYLNPITVTCDDGTDAVLDPAAGPGNVWNADNADPDDGDAVWQYAVYRGEESLTCGSGSCNKAYWNVAVGFDPSVAGCHLSASGTAANGASLTDGETPDGATYPFIGFEVDLTGESGGLACSEHRLNIAASGIATAYTNSAAPMLFCHGFTGGAFSNFATANPACQYGPPPPPQGVSLAADIRPGSGGGIIYSPAMAALGDSVYFNAWDGSSQGIQLFGFDGATATLAAAPNPSTHSFIINVLNVAGAIYFAADDGAHGYEPWVFDGSTASLVADVNPSGHGTAITAQTNWMVEYGGDLYFQGSTGSDAELWRWDGTAATQVTDINPSGHAYPAQLLPWMGDLYFAATDGTSGIELWRFDGTDATRVVDLNPGSNGSNPLQLTVHDGELYFFAKASSGFDLYRYDGATVSLAADLPGVANPSGAVVYGGDLYWGGPDASGNTELWRFDGINATAVTSIYPGGNAQVASPVVFDGEILFWATDGATGRELWRWDGTSASQLADICAGACNSDPRAFTEAGGILYFVANDGVLGAELWRYVP